MSVSTDEAGDTTLTAETFAVILQHAGEYLALPDVCALLCSAHMTAAVVTKHFHGRLAVKFRPKSLAAVHSFSSWLCKHGQMLQRLEFHPKLPLYPYDTGAPMILPEDDVPANLRDFRTLNSDLGATRDHFSLAATLDGHCSLDQTEDNAGAAVVLACALRAAQRSGQLEHFVSFTCRPWDATPQLLLQSLPCSVTHIKIEWESATSSWFGYEKGPDWNGLLAYGLQAFTGLQSLSLQTPPDSRVLSEVYSVYKECAELFQAIQSLQHLTELEYWGYPHQHYGYNELDVSNLFPTTLRHLIFTPDFPKRPIDFSHMTALTEMRWDCGFLNGSPEQLDPYDRRYMQLGVAADSPPPNLVRLGGWSCDNTHSIEVLKGLRSLRHLDGLYSLQQVIELVQAVPGLTHIGLKFSICQTADEDRLGRIAAELTAAGVTPSIVGSLMLTSPWAVELDVLQHITQLSGLTSVNLAPTPPCEYTLQKLREMLPQLPALSRVRLPAQYSREYKVVAGDLVYFADTN